MRVFCSAIFAATLFTAALSAPPVLAQTSSSTEVPQNRVIGSWMNSLLYHSDNWRAVPPWLKRMAVAKGGQNITAQAGYDFQQYDPPNWDQDWTPIVASPNARSTWKAYDAANFTDILLVTDNFNAPPVYGPGPTDPSVGGQVPRPDGGVWPDEFQQVITAFEANTNDTPTYWVYEGWADAGKLFDEGTGAASAQNFADWRLRTTTQYGYTTWFDNLLSQTQANVPDAASRIKMIPIARTMVSVMENTAASAITADEWFEDDAPHGHDTCYLLVAMIVYSALYQEQAPMPEFRGADINETFKNNYNDIAKHIFENM